MHIYLKEKSNCIEDSFYKCFVSKMLTSNNFSRNCLPTSLLKILGSYEDQFCESEQKLNHSYVAYDEFKRTKCPKSCSIIEYTGKLDYWDPKTVSQTKNTSFVLTLRFAPPEAIKVFEEFLIYDGIGMVGSVAGTLGMFVGFSFDNVVAYLFSSIRKKLKY